MKNTLQVGRRYLSRVHSKPVTIIEKTPRYYLGNDGIRYNPQGVAFEKGASWDLVHQDEDYVYKMLKALGILYSKSGKEVLPYKKHRPKLVSERNFYQSSHKDEDWEWFVTIGHATRLDLQNAYLYSVTDSGIKLLRDMGYIFEVEELK
jgi:hypothetical protein